MIKSLTKEFTVFPSSSSSRTDMSAYNLVNMFQDVVTEHSRLMGIDTPTMQLSSEGFWAVTKHKMKIHRAPGLYETVSAETWPEKPGPVRGGRNFLIKDSGGNVIVESRSEWVILDMADHHIRKMSDTIYPITDEHIDKRLLPDPFLRIKETVCPDDYVYTHIVRPSDIDLSQHTNNAVYVRLFEDCFPLSFFEENRVGSIEINYANESKIGAEILLYKKPLTEGYYIQASSPEGKIYAFCKLETVKR